MRHAVAMASLIGLMGLGLVSCISAPVVETSTTTNFASDADTRVQRAPKTGDAAFESGAPRGPTFPRSEGLDAFASSGIIGDSYGSISHTVASPLLPGNGDSSLPPLTEAGPVPKESPLLGFYDVNLEPAPELAGCRPESASTHLQLVLELNDGFEIEARVSPDFGYPYVVSITTSDEAVQLSANPGDSPQLTLARNADGTFSGTGVAVIAYTCETTVTARTVAVTIGPDVTPARSRVTHDFPNESSALRAAVPVGAMFNVGFSEMVNIGEGQLRMAPALHEELEELVAVVDDDTNELLHTRANFNFAGGVSLEFADYDEAKNRNVRIEFLYEVTDRAGNPVLAPSQVFQVMDVGSLETAIDFDYGAHPGVWGNARYVPAGTADSPCEAGGCVVIDEEVPLCEDWQASGPTSTFNFRLPLTAATDGFRVRSRLLSTQATTANTRLWWNRGCNLEVVPTVLPSLTEPDGEFTYGTEWTDTAMSLAACGGQGDDKNLALTLTCLHPQSMPPEGVRVRYVIERIERYAP